MNKLLWIFVGGGLGSVARYYLGKWFNGADLLMPYGTFSANVLGSFFIGFLTGIFISRHWINTQWAPAILIGFFGRIYHLFHLYVREFAFYSPRPMGKFFGLLSFIADHRPVFGSIRFLFEQVCVKYNYLYICIASG